MVPPRLEVIIPLVQVPLFNNCDFLFYLATQVNLTLYTHIIDYKTSKILVKNPFDQLVCISQYHKLSYLLIITYDNYFLANMQSVHDLAAFLPLSCPFSNLSTGHLLLTTNLLMEIVLDNEIRVYGKAVVIKQIADLMIEYPLIWEFESFVQIPPKRWINVMA